MPFLWAQLFEVAVGGRGEVVAVGKVHSAFFPSPWPHSGFGISNHSFSSAVLRRGDSPAPPLVPLPALRGVISPQTALSTSSLYPLLGLLLPWQRPN